MSLFKNRLGTALLLAAAVLPMPGFADDAPPSAPAVDQLSPTPNPAERAQLMQTMRARMQEILKTEDSAKRRELIDAQAKDMDAMMKLGPPGPGMGMGMMMGPGGMGAGPGMMMGQGANPDCKLGQGPGMGPGMGMMMGPSGKPNCKTGGHPNCAMRAGEVDQRLDALEKRMDMMQMMMKMMMRE